MQWDSKWELQTDDYHGVTKETVKCVLRNLIHSNIGQLMRDCDSCDVVSISVSNSNFYIPTMDSL